MSANWQTIEQAAVTLGLSVRTVNRHITAGKLQSRLFEGRREVLVDGTAQQGPVDNTWSSKPPTSQPTAVSSSASASTTQPIEPAQSPTTNASQQVSPEVARDRPFDVQAMLALTDSIDDKASLAVVAYQTLAQAAESQVQSLRKIAFGAWAVVGVIAVGVIIAVGWAASSLTRAEMSTSHLHEQVTRMAEQAKQQTAVIERISRERDLAISQANTERERQLAELRERSSRSATLPTGFEALLNELIQQREASAAKDALGSNPIGKRLIGSGAGGRVDGSVQATQPTSSPETRPANP